ncbi:RNA-binding protein hfq [Hydrococcus rivularis NIES-593]|uniref:RNA-binding protein hfq n=1 Tax=Hydrococcus rivularis NIES-593 TaxID=1921803 RepID=A0A1U7HHJ4_9CYAN|nr:RNA chaperone Hfq [Hydrococcus rivularis]OKH23008.1 RNA-binding protein hfq [Hydrococcus rivularis NIES-593]
MSDFNTGLPSIRQIQSSIKDKREVELKLVTNDLLMGKILWQDSNCICLVDENEQQILIWRRAIAYLKPKA